VWPVSFSMITSIFMPLIASFQGWYSSNYTIKWTWYHPKISGRLRVIITKQNRPVYSWINGTIKHMSIHTTSSGNYWSEIERICSFTSSWSFANSQPSNICIK
jgi:hypothetical protein